MTWGQAFCMVMSQSFIHGQTSKDVGGIKQRVGPSDWARKAAVLPDEDSRQTQHALILVA